MYRVLYREYRPETFKELIGQDNIVRILSNQIKNDSVGHAYLFCGTRGTGKTTTARLLAKGVNCLADQDRPCGHCQNCKDIAEGRFIDVVEVDAASNNGIDDVKAIRESVLYPPAIGRKKVYIIDEVHMMSKPGFNALLKTLEEPPANVIFILATTDPDKLPQTILSRCIRMDFRRVPKAKLVEQMRLVCQDRGVEIDDPALGLIAMNADGSVRDCLTLLEQAIAGRSGKIDRGSVLDALGAVGDETYLSIVNTVEAGKIEDIFLILDQLFSNGKDARQILTGIIEYYRNLMFIKHVSNAEDHLNLSREIIEAMRPHAEAISMDKIRTAIVELSKLSYDANLSTQPRTLLELALVRLAAGQAGQADLDQEDQGSPIGILQAKPQGDSQKINVQARTGQKDVNPDQEARQAIGASGQGQAENHKKDKPEKQQGQAERKSGGGQDSSSGEDEFPEIGSLFDKYS